MPNALASGKGKFFWWNANVTPPKDYAKWDALITALVKHWTNRYGEGEVKTWRFEIWNEPNYPGFWHPPTNSTPRGKSYSGKPLDRQWFASVWRRNFFE
jgi:xylan 1,4-beta-xylosidase